MREAFLQCRSVGVSARHIWLLQAHLATLLEKGFEGLVTAGRLQDLARLYAYVLFLPNIALTTSCLDGRSVHIMLFVS